MGKKTKTAEYNELRKERESIIERYRINDIKAVDAIRELNAINAKLRKMVCSNCADNLWSLVTTVHLSPSNLVCHTPALTIGSMVKVIPSSKT